MSRYLWADDLTGAAELATEIAVRDTAPVHVQLRPPGPPSGTTVVHDLDLRHLPPAGARDRLEASLRGLSSAEPLALKVDSQAHGPVTGYLRAMLDAGRSPVLCLANPATGRVTTGGRHHVPTSRGDVVTDLRALVAALPHRVIQPGHAPDAGTGEVWLADAVTAGDLRGLARLAHEHRRDPVGSAPFLAAYDALGAPARRTPPARQAAPASARSLLAVVGSHEPLARRQVDRLAADRPTRVVTVDRDEPEPAATRLAVAPGHVLVLRPGAGMDAGALGAVAARIAGESAPEETALFATGGHTARRVLDHLGADVLRVTRPPVPAVACFCGAGGRVVVTKPGSYGSSTTLSDLAHALLEPTSQEHR